ncbi:M20/M25/M40 family metallo-hydrolase [Robertmurraya kyonggiensis]|uniref:M20/M25/M40 family metallo-hydrolase n=1 Tax=Robertmurraya kyonggiensis TaxID=1037680 RepID=A0A4U1D988_9BACI|nr:M20/M25/M40 family metallo-hydrolase [Robertmurraya kyonggiensis]TKC18077.1 M20/M25/M40 family metallo-hydrolase [Robertmurraya kyonggiensis]
MFKRIQGLQIEQQIELLTRELIEIQSYSGTNGEIHKAEWLFNFLQSFSYYQVHPDHLIIREIENDSYERKNVFALLKSPKNTTKTVIYFAHFDTVGTEDFGSIQAIAHNPDALEKYFSTYKSDEDVMADAQSGEWLFGRGSLDMQSGVAVHVANLLYFSEHLDELDGNILVMFNPDEERQHTGIRGALSELIRLKEKYALEYVAALNNDLISPLYPEDSNKYIYTGTAGKLLPCFAVFGREAHVGESLSGIDPTTIASEINLRINQNLDLVEKIEGELVLPPSCLYFRDDKKQYNVQTALSARLYFNYFYYEKTPHAVLDGLAKIAEEACHEFEARLKTSYSEFVKLNQLPKRDLSWTVEVTTLENYIGYLQGLRINEIDRIIEGFQNTDLDEREAAYEIVDALQKLDPEKKPRVIIFYAPPFLPSNYLNLNNERGSSLSEKIQAVLEKEATETGEIFKLRKYFPYLSDGSFLSFEDSEEEIRSLKRNFPALDTLFPIPLEKMKELNIPSINVGVYGKDAHKWTERVYKPYSFGYLPRLIREITRALLQD